MDKGNATGEVWARLIQEIIASWRLVLRAAVLLLACTPAVAVFAIVFVFLVSR